MRAAGGTPVVGDLIADSVDDLAGRMRGHDAVVFSAGAHGTGQDKTTLIDGRGLQKAADAAALAGVARFVLVSVFPDALRDGTRSEGFEHYIKVKKTADVYLTRSDLDWLIVRPGTLLDTPAPAGSPPVRRRVRRRAPRRRRRVPRRRPARADPQPRDRRAHLR
ncbi:NAD(P)H-binding protein [Streptomyces stelliscabiei]